MRGIAVASLFSATASLQGKKQQEAELTSKDVKQILDAPQLKNARRVRSLDPRAKTYKFEMPNGQLYTLTYVPSSPVSVRRPSASGDIIEDSKTPAEYSLQSFNSDLSGPSVSAQSTKKTELYELLQKLEERLESETKPNSRPRKVNP